MILFTHHNEWSKLLESYVSNRGSVGYVPTMGALHDGHASLIERAAQENEICVMSIFVNPTQFNEESDLVAYPKTLTEDLIIAEKAGCDFVFAPQAESFYNGRIESTSVDYGTLTSSLEGAHRPGHFDGVATVVRMLLNAINPHRAYFGEKDFQQLAIIREMVKREQIPTKIVGCDLIRDKDGLALSSRNVRLSPKGRQNALAISQTLFQLQPKVEHSDPKLLSNWGMRHLEQQPGIEMEYFSIVDAETLAPATSWNRPTRALVACWVEGVRLIDNIALS